MNCGSFSKTDVGPPFQMNLFVTPVPQTNTLLLLL